MGTSWITEVLSFMMEGSFEVINTLVGLYVFVIFFCKLRNWHTLENSFHC